MAFQISAGVNVNEIDLTTGVPGIGTTTGAAAIHTTWGPTNIRVLVNSEDTLVAQFGKPNANTAEDFFTVANFLGYTNSCYVVRVIDETSADTGRNSHGALANTADTVIDNNDDYENNHSNGIAGVGGWVAKYPGVLGNSLRVSVCANAAAFSSTLSVGTIAITNGSSVVTGTTTLFNEELVVGDFVILGPDKKAIKVAEVTNATSIILASAYVGTDISGDNAPARRWEYFNEFDIAPGTSDFATRVGGSLDEMHIAIIDEDGEITGTANQVVERFAGVSAASDAKNANGSDNYYRNVINTRSKWIWWAQHLAGATSFGNKAAGTVFGAPDLPVSVSLVNGRDGATPTNADYLRGFDKFKNAEEVDISFVLGAAADSTRALHIIDNIAEVRKDCLAVLSPERSDVVNNAGYVNKEMDDIIAFRNLLTSSSYATIDSGWKYQYDKYNDLFRYIPTNGDTAGLMARTDAQRDPWFSPAGYNRGIMKNAIKLAFNPDKTARDQLYKNGINPVITQDGTGTLLFGDKTMLDKPSAFDRINVRRLFIVLEKAIAQAAKFSLFEFNDEFTRAQFRNLVEPFLRDVQGRRGIFDFRVVADETNNTAEVIDRNEFVGDIYIKPARAINFIQLNFVAVRSGVEFSEIVGQF